MSSVKDERHSSPFDRVPPPSPTPVAGRTVLKIGGFGAVVGGGLLLAGNIVHPRESGQLADAESLMEVAAGSPIWVIDHFTLLVAVSLLLAGFYGLSRSFTSFPARSWARLAWSFSIVGTVFAAALMVTEATAVAKVADQWTTASGATREVTLAAGTALYELSLIFGAGGMLFLFGATPMLFGVAILAGKDHPRWTGWFGMLFAIVAVVAFTVQVVAGQTTLALMRLSPIAGIGFTVWILYLGARMWRHSAGQEEERP